jgi:hypothetical protein
MLRWGARQEATGHAASQCGGCNFSNNDSSLLRGLQRDLSLPCRSPSAQGFIKS